MDEKIKQVIKNWMPPMLINIGKYILKRDIVWYGNYVDWKEAKSDSLGYESNIILEKVKEAMFNVKNGNALYERDAQLFKIVEYSWPLLSGLMWISAIEGGKLNLIDFGGSLGSSYFQNREFLEELEEVNWNVVEQKHFVECGKNNFENETLHFYDSMDVCLEIEKPNTIILSGVIQYLEKPYEFLEQVIKKSFKYIIIDRTPMTAAGKERLTIQRVSSSNFNISYPCWFFNEERFLDYFKKKYYLVAEFEAIDKANIASKFKGYIFRKVK